MNLVKMQIPLGECMVFRCLSSFVLQQSGFAFFVRELRLAHFFILGGFSFVQDHNQQKRTNHHPKIHSRQIQMDSKNKPWNIRWGWKNLASASCIRKNKKRCRMQIGTNHTRLLKGIISQNSFNKKRCGFSVVPLRTLRNYDRLRRV